MLVLQGHKWLKMAFLGVAPAHVLILASMTIGDRQPCFELDLPEDALSICPCDSYWITYRLLG